MILETDRLRVRTASASEGDVAFYHRLWNHPEVMANVGFPRGLGLSREQIRAQLARQREGPFDVCLVVELRETGARIGECRLGSPDGDGLSETDVKLLPEHWGRGIGTELKRALVGYLFEHAGCRGVKATPNVRNRASQRMQEKVGARRVGEEVHRFPEAMRHFTEDVHAYVYVVFREDWERGGGRR